MMFILRAIFWLAVVSAILPPRGGDEPGLGETAGRAIGATMDYCAEQPEICIESARSTLDAARIPADFVLRVSEFAGAGPQAAAPQPQPKPSRL